VVLLRVGRPNDDAAGRAGGADVNLSTERGTPAPWITVGDVLDEVGNVGTNRQCPRIDAKLPDALAVGGRGLPLIAALADTAAFVPTAHGHVLPRITKQLAC
jgi:hypothetical protein